MYACSPKWKDDWISKKDLRDVLLQLSGRIKGSPFGPERVGLNYGLHFTGGEPFLNFPLLVEAVVLAHELGIPSMFVETGCYWCINEDVTREKLSQLANAGLDGLLVSVNPFLLEQVPFERTQRAVNVGRELFGGNLLVYQQTFYDQFEALEFRNVVPFVEYMRRCPTGLKYAELIPMGRAPYRLGHLFKKYPASHFFGESCREELTRGWHIHVDNYCNYMTGYCGGISLGDARHLDTLTGQGIDLEEHPILAALVTDIEELYKLGMERFGYKAQSEGYISKCHLCTDIRRYIIAETDEFRELNPREFYFHLD